VDRSLLYGQDPSERIVGLHPADPGTMRVYRREGDRIVHADEPWFPFFFLTDASLLSGFPRHHWIKELEGTLQYRFLCAFESVPDFLDAVRLLLQRCGIVTSSPEDHLQDLDVMFTVADPQWQYFLQTGRTLFKGLPFGELRRLHIEPRFEREPGASRPRRLTGLFLSDCLGWEVAVDRGSEREILRKLLDAVQKHDPDLLQGPSLYRSTLPRLTEIAEAAGIPLAIGRDNSVPAQPAFRLTDPSSPREAPLWEVAGRLVLDLPGGEPDMTFEQSGMRVSGSQPQALMFFELSQLAPPAHGNIRFPGIVKRFEHILMREYMRVRHSLPPLTPRGQAQKESREVLYTGLLGPAIEAGFAGLHARELLEQKVVSRNDPLGVIPAVMRTLIALMAERPTEPAWGTGSSENAFEALLATVLPYLQTGRTLFGDHESAAELAAAVRGTISSIEASLRQRDAKLVSIHGEKLIIVPPPEVASPEQELAFLAHFAASDLPGVSPIPRGRYKRVLCFRKHDIAHLEYDGRCVIRGSDLLSPGLERFGRAFVEGCTRALLENDLKEMHRLYLEIHGAITRRTWDIRDFARTETIVAPLQKYVQEVEEGKRERSAPYEVLLRTGRWLPPGSRVSTYVTQTAETETEARDVIVDGPPLPPGTNAAYAFSRRWRGAEEWDRNFPDEDTSYYLDRLEGLARRFAPFFDPEEYHVIFSSDELFPFDPAGIAPVTRRVQADADDAPPPIHLGIWLDQ